MGSVGRRRIQKSNPPSSEFAEDCENDHYPFSYHLYLCCLALWTQANCMHEYYLDFCDETTQISLSSILHDDLYSPLLTGDHVLLL